MDDHEELTQLVHRYAELLDTGRLAEVAELFARATWRTGATGEALTHEQVRAVYDRVILYEDGTPRTKHLITNLTLRVDADAGSASGSCYFTVIQGVEPGKPIQTILSGRYTDRFAKDEHGWYFTDRLFTPDLIGDQSSHFRTGR